MEGHYQFKYAPWIALLFGALYSWLPLGFAHGAHYALVALLTLGGLRFLVRGAGLREGPPLRWMGCALLVFAVSIREEWKLGQANVLALALLLPAFLVEPKGKKAPWVALAFAHAILLKLYVLAAIPWFVFRKERAFLRWTAVSLLFFLLVAPSLVQGFSFAWGELARWGATLRASTDGLLFSTHNVSIRGFAGRLVGGNALSFGLWGAACLSFVFLTHRAAHEPGRWGFAWTLLAIPLLSPLGWAYWSLFAIPAFFLLAASKGKDKAFLLAAGLLGLVLLFQGVRFVREWLVCPALLGFTAVFYLSSRSRESAVPTH